MNFTPADRLAHIQPFHVMALLARAKELEAQGRDIVHMEIGEPDFDTPEPIVAAAQRALQAGATHYTPALGLPELREAIARHYRQRHGVDVPARRVIVTPGGSGALLLALGALVSPGREVLMTDPGYPCNRNFVRFVDGVPRPVPVTAATHYQFAPEHVEQYWTERAAAAMLASPSNPTGTLLAPDALREIVAQVHARGGAVIVDEIYHGLVYAAHAPTALAYSDDVFVVNSFSKYFHMTGWRLGWLIAPERFVPLIDKLAQNLFLAAPTLAQHAALAAFEPATLEILERRRAEFQRRRDFLIPELRALGFGVPVVPEGAFYVYVDSSTLAEDSFALTTRMLEDVGVAFTPGIDFGAYQPERHVRFAYTTSIDRLREGVRRLAAALNSSVLPS
jgi:aspartate/methionine/tyrosine aminotransferase